MRSQEVKENNKLDQLTFLDLSLELRQKIYSKTLCPLVDFCIEYTSFESETFEESDTFEESEEPFIVPPKISYSTPSLFLVSKQVSSEARQVIAPIRRLLSASVSSGKIHSSPSPEFLSLCAQSRFIFNDFCEQALSFLNSLSEELGNSIYSIAIYSGSLYADDYPTREAWSKSDAGNKTPFIALIRSKLPSLQQVSLYVPARVEDFYCSYAPISTCGLLEDETIDEVRLLYDGMVNVDYVSQIVHMHPKP